MAPYLCLTNDDNVALRQNDCVPKSPSQRSSVRVGCRLKLRQPRVSSKRFHEAESEDGPPHSERFASRIDLVKQVPKQMTKSMMPGETADVLLDDLNNDLTHRRSMIIRSNALGLKDKVFSCRDLELALSSEISLPSSSASYHDDPCGHSESSTGSVSLKSVCPKIPPSVNDSPHRSKSRRRAVSPGGASTEGVRRPSSVRRFSRREPLSPHSVSIDRGRQRSFRRLETSEDPRSLLEMHLDLRFSGRSPGRSREKSPKTGRAIGYAHAPSQDSCMIPQRRRPSGSETVGAAFESIPRKLPDQVADGRSKGYAPSIGHLPYAPSL
jgi:hypothetical protein